MTLSRSQLEALTATDIREPIPEAELKEALSSAPFIASDSLFNLRDLGRVQGSPIPEGRIYRCGNLGKASKDPAALAWLSAHVGRIFDLRQDLERSVFPSPEIPDIENVWFDMSGPHEEISMEEWAVGDGSQAWRDQYLMIAGAYKPTFCAILEHVRDRPTEPILFHCTVGRDRTGVVAGLLQSLAGASEDTVLYDYMLTRIGTEPERERLTAYVMKSFGVTDLETPGFLNFASLRPVFWTTFQEELKAEYGSWDGYVTEGLGFSNEHLERIKANLRG